MAKESSEWVLAGVELNRDSRVPIYQQLYEALRGGILEGRLRPGSRLPPTRELARQFEISRTTVLLAFDHLLAEGYVEGKAGSGTYVSHAIPEQFLEAEVVRSHTGPGASSGKGISQRGKRMTGTGRRNTAGRLNLVPFRPGVPALRDFPFEQWMRILSRSGRSLRHEDYGYGDPAGYLPLRQAIAEYLRTARAVKCEAGQVIIFSGAQEALFLSCHLLLDKGDAAWLEDPGYTGAREAMNSAGLKICPVPVDEKGLEVVKAKERYPEARLAYVTPSHQYPSGVTMSLSRRMQLLEWAARNKAWILEDDYDSEYRYGGKPLSSLQGIDTNDCVIYMGTFSKVLFPALRVAYIVVPPSLVDTFTAARDLSMRNGPVLEQAALACFMEEGHFGRHIRRMRLLYQQRQECMVETIRAELSNRINVQPSLAGLHLVGWLVAGADDKLWSQRMAMAGLVVPPVSAYSLRCDCRPGLVMGYAPFNEREIKKAVSVIKKVLADLM